MQPVLLVAFRDSFKRSVALTSAIFSVSGLVGAVSSPFLGRLLDRFGPRVMFPIAATLILVGWLASSKAGDMWQLFIFYSVVATLGQFTISSFSATATLAPWFPRSKGIVLGMADSGNPAGQAIVVPPAQLIVTTMGWRTAYSGVWGRVFPAGSSAEPALSAAAAGRVPGGFRGACRGRRRPGRAGRCRGAGSRTRGGQAGPGPGGVEIPAGVVLAEQPGGGVCGEPDDHRPHHCVSGFVRLRGAGSGVGPGVGRAVGDRRQAGVRATVRLFGQRDHFHHLHGDADRGAADGAGVRR